VVKTQMFGMGACVCMYIYLAFVLWCRLDAFVQTVGQLNHCEESMKYND